ncbi:MAG: beta-N-acetylhexosaminidase [Pseudomonadota bacterium]
MTLGPIMLDVEGPSLTDADRERLMHPQTGGVILFSRNYESPQQLQMLCSEILELRDPSLLIAVDQEGGRVQRFREGFQSLPALGKLGELFDRDADRAIHLSQTFGWIMAAELLNCGVDLSFAPVLDIGDPVSSVIGDRAFHQNPDVISRLANAWIRGMSEAGMASVGKHFPGHGSVEGDSHHVMPFDRRSFDEIESLDLVPFRRVMSTQLSAVMMAHVAYEQVDDCAAGFSRYWIESVLRQRLAFEGVVFSDDLSMSGAEAVGGYAERARRSLEAGCDMLLVCNNPQGADEVLSALEGYSNPTAQLRMVRMHARKDAVPADLFSSDKWLTAIDELADFNRQSGLSEGADLFE